MLTSCFLSGGEFMARCIIIAPLYRGEESAWLRKRAGDLVICADGGFRAAQAYGVTPDLVIGDFDSLGYVPEGVDVIQLPVHKDDTDLVVCIREGRRRGYQEFIVAGCLGGRFDHTLSCLQCAADCANRGEKIWLCDDQNRVTVLGPGSYEIAPLTSRLFSVLAYTPAVTGVTLKGTKWTLDNAELTNNYPLGCSNEIVDGCARLTFESGLLVMCLSGDER